jgi:hypothetical protein
MDHTIAREVLQLDRAAWSARLWKVGATIGLGLGVLIGALAGDWMTHNPADTFDTHLHDVPISPVSAVSSVTFPDTTIDEVRSGPVGAPASSASGGRR